MNTIKIFFRLFCYLSIVMVISSCKSQNNNSEIVRQLIEEVNSEIAGESIDNFTMLGMSLEGNDIVFSSQLPMTFAEIGQTPESAAEAMANSELAALCVGMALDELDEDEVNAIINGGYNILFRYYDRDNEYCEIIYENSDIVEYFSE